jgi:UTP--glucose-1-phosphate uridylyltransferase
MIKKVVIPAAGLGTRFLPATKAQPKEMLPIVDKPTIQYIVEEAIGSGVESILIITGRNKRAIEDHFDRSLELEIELEKSGKQEMLKLVREIGGMVNLHFIRQKTPRGLGDAILCAKDFVGNEPFGVLLGDDIVVSKKPALKQLFEIYEKYDRTVVGIQEVPHSDVSKYGIIAPSEIIDGTIKVASMVEKPSVDLAPSNLAIMGRYVLSPAIFDALEKQQEGKDGEIQLTDAIEQLAKSEGVYAFNFEGKRYDVGNKMGYLMATCEFALANPELHDQFSQYIKELSMKL